MANPAAVALGRLSARKRAQERQEMLARIAALEAEVARLKGGSSELTELKSESKRPDP